MGDHTARRPGRHRGVHGRHTADTVGAAHGSAAHGSATPSPVTHGPAVHGPAVHGSRVAAALAATAATVGAVVAVPAFAAAAPTAADPPANPEDTPAARAAHAEPLVPGTPCTVTTRACVDLDSQRAWLIEDGRVVRGPMRVSTGAAGHETPVGHSLRVYRQDADHVSDEIRLPDGRPAPMPWSTFFADGGVAFHGGNVTRASSGCVHMTTADAEAVFHALDNGDKVQVVHGVQERLAHAAAGAP